jgi:hypothetical protein
MMVLQGTEIGRQVAHLAGTILSVVNLLEIAESRTAQLSEVYLHPVLKDWRLRDEDLARPGRSLVTGKLDGEHFE